ncbi:hypothetical protein DVH24_024373 [Malus domestica]|uniref:Uncharacterized protein n=1 Tax=Malus domestica TaxID=3750 RepID=A0A498JFR7_MALDO|nr:hypothetical protein DVH24_024373 [Malus domestica]
MPLAVLHMPPRLQRLDRLKIVQARNVIDRHRTRTEVPIRIPRNRERGFLPNEVVYLGRRSGGVGGGGRGDGLGGLEIGVEEERVRGAGAGEEEDCEADE